MAEKMVYKCMCGNTMFKGDDIANEEGSIICCGSCGLEYRIALHTDKIPHWHTLERTNEEWQIFHGPIFEKSMYKAVQDFYDQMGFSRPARPTRIASERRNQRMAYILSETMEFGAASELLDQVDAMVDLLYFVIGTFVELGIDPQVPFEIVHKANMAKLWPDGKAHMNHAVVPPRLLRPDGWEASEEKIHIWLEQQLQK